MKNLVFLIFCVILLVSCGNDSGTNADDYNSGGDLFPIKLGNFWNYYKESEGFEATLTITEAAVVFVWDGMANSTRMSSDAQRTDGSGSASIFDLGNRELSKQSNGVYVGAYKSDKIQTIYFLPNQPTVGTDSYGNTWSKVESIVTKKGTYKYCWKCTLGGSLSGYMIFKKGVGVVYANNIASNIDLESYTLK